MRKWRIKQAGRRILALQAAAALLFAAAFVSIPAERAKAAEEKIHMDENAYREMGFDIQEELPDDSYLGPGNMVMCPQSELYFDFNGSSNYGYIMRDNLNLYQTVGDNLSKAGAYKRYGQYKNGGWANLEDKYGYTDGSLGGDVLFQGLTSKNTHQNRVYATSTEFKSATGRDDRVAQIYITSSEKRSDFTVYLEILKFTGNRPGCVSTVKLGNPEAVRHFGLWCNEQYDALFEITAGDYDGDGVDEVAVYCADNEVKIFKTTNDRLTLWQTIGQSELKADTGVLMMSEDNPNQNLMMAAVVSLSSGDLKKDYTEDLVIGVSMPEQVEAKKNNRTFIYGYKSQSKKLAKDETIDLNEVADISGKLPMLAVNTAIGDLTGNGRQELVIGGRVGEKIGVIHVEYDFDTKKYNSSAPQLMDQVDETLLKKNQKWFFYYAPIGLSICNFGTAGGKMQRLFLFDRLYSWQGELFERQDQALYFATNQRNNANEKTGKEAVWISKVISGNFIGAKNGSQQLAALVGVKESGQDKYWYEICFIAYDFENALWHTSWEGIINQATSYLNNDSRSKASAYVALSMPDVDEDSMLLKYLGVETYYTKPEVQAVLQSAPYFQDVADTYDNYLNEGSTAYGVSKGSSKSVTAGLELSVGIYASASLSLFVAAEYEHGISAATSYEHEKNKETTTSVEYAVGEGDDYVVMFTIPYNRYWYEYKDEKGKMQKMTIEEPMTPSTVVVPVETYDHMAETYQGLEPIEGNLLKTVPGEPSTYEKTFQNKDFTRIGEVQRLSNAGTNSSSNVTVSREVSVTEEDSISVAVEEELKVGVGAGLADNEVMAGITQSAAISAGEVRSKMNGVSYAGTVDNLPAGVSGYGFSWQFGAQETNLNDEGVVLIGYQTSNVRELPKIPQNLAITEIGSREMVLEWDASADAAVYELMLITNNGMELPQASVPGTQRDENGNVSYRVTNLMPGTQYSYTVTALNAAGARSLSSAQASGTTLSEDQAGFRITAQPQDQEVSVGHTAVFAVETENDTGKPLNYRWQRYDASAKIWQYISGEYDKKMSVTGEGELDGSKYRCIIYTGGTVLISSAASLRIGKSESSTSLSIRRGSETLRNDAVVQSAGIQEVQKQVGTQDITYTVTVEKGGVIYTKLQNSAGDILWTASDADGDHYYADHSGTPADSACDTADRIVFAYPDEDENESAQTFLTVDAAFIAPLPEGTSVPAGMNATGGYRILGETGGYVFAVTDTDEGTGYYDADGKKLALYDTRKLITLGGSDQVNAADFSEVEDVRQEPVYETTTEPVAGDALTFTAKVADKNDSNPITDQTPTFQIVNVASGVSSTAASQKGSAGAYTCQYTFRQSGIYKITAVYSGSGQYTMSRSESVTLVVKGAEAQKQLFISGGSMTYGETMNLAPKIVESNGMTEANSVNYTVKKDGASIDVNAARISRNYFTPQSAGVYVITAEDTANHVSVSTEVKVSRRTLTITPPSLEGVLADSRETRQKKLNDAVSSVNTDAEGKVSVQGLAEADQITDYSLTSDAVAATRVGEYPIIVSLNESSTNIKNLLEKYTFVLNRGVYKMSSDRVRVTAEAGANGTISIRYRANNSSQWITVSSGAYIPKGARLTVSAQPANGFGIEKWTVNGSDVQNYTEESYIVDALNQDISIRAAFSYHYGTLTYDAGEGGSLQGAYEGSGQIGFPSGGQFNQNQSVILTAVPDEGYVVERWMIRTGSQPEEEIKAEDGTSTYTGTNYTVSNVREDVSIKVIFRRKVARTVSVRFKDRADNDGAFTLGATLKVNGETITEKDSRYVYQSFSGDNLTLDITIPDNMLVDHWALVDGNGKETTAAGNVKQLKLYNLDADLNYIVYCSIPNVSRISYESVLDDTNGNGGTLAAAGTITAEGNASSPVSRPQGTHLTFTAVPNEGYSIRGWTSDGEKVQDNITVNTDGSQTYRMEVKADARIQVHFEKKPVITFTSDPSRGSVTAVTDGKNISTGKAAEFGSSVEWTITPVNKYEIERVTLNGTDITANLQADSQRKDIRRYTAENVQANQSFAVTFRALETYTVGYEVADLDDDGAGDYGQIEASAGRLGLAAYEDSKEAALTGEITVYEGGEAVFVPVPESDRYEVKEYMVNGTVYTPEDDGTLRLTAGQLKTFDEPIRLTVKFGAAQFSKLEYEAGEHGSVSGVYTGKGQISFPSGGQLNKRQSVILTAVPDEGYVVDYWTIQKGTQGTVDQILAEDQKSTYTRTAYTVSNLTEDTWIKVYFKVKVEKTVTLQFKDLEGGVDAFTNGTSLQINGETIQNEGQKYTYQSFCGDNLVLDIGIPDNMLVDHWSVQENGGAEVKAAESVDQIKIYDLPESRDYIVYCSIPNTSRITYGAVLDNTHGNGGTPKEAGEITAEGISSSPVSLPQGVELTFTAVPGVGYGIRKWTVNGTEVTQHIHTNTDGSQVYQMEVNDDASVQVHFEKKPVITVTADNTKGAVAAAADGQSLQPGQTAEFGSSLEWTVIPKKGYVIEQALLNGEDVTKQLTADESQKDTARYRAENVQANQELAVTFRALKAHTIRYAVVDQDGDGVGDRGSLEASAARLGMEMYQEQKEASRAGEITAYEGGEVLFRPLPDSAAYRVTQCLVNGEPYALQENGTILFAAEQLASLDQTVNLTVKFGSSAPVITFTNPVFDGREMGTLTAFAAGTEVYSGAAVNGAVSFEVSPGENYEVKQWLVNGKEASEAVGNRFVYTNEARIDTNVAVVLQGVQLNLKASAKPAQAGSADGLPQVIRYGDHLSLKAQAEPGFVFDGWYLGEKKISGQEEYSFTAEKDAAYVAKFEAKHPREVYQLSLAHTGQGDVTATVEGVEASSVEEGMEVTFAAVPKSYWSFGRWTVNGEKVSYGESFTLTAGKDFQEDLTVSASFEEAVYYDVSFGAGGEGGTVAGTADGVPMAGGQVLQKVGGSRLKFLAEPEEGYMIAEWSVNGKPAEGNITNELEIESLVRNTNVTASFRPYQGYMLPASTDIYEIADIVRNPSDTKPDDQIREGGTLIFTVRPAGEDKAFTKLEIYGVDCLSIPPGTEQEIQLQGQVSKLMAEKNEDGSYTVQLQNVRENIGEKIQAETAVGIGKAVVRAKGCEHFVYNGREQLPAGVDVILNGTVLPETEYQIVYSDAVNAGTVQMKVTGTGDYTGTAEGTYQIAPRPLTVAADSMSKNYGDADPQLTWKTEGLLEGDTVQVTLRRKAGEEPGTYEIYVTADAGANYAATCKNGVFTIQAAGAQRPGKEKITADMLQSMNAGLRMTWKGSAITVKWGKVTAADGYGVFITECNKKYPKKPTVTVHGAAKTEVKIKKISGKKLSSAKAYKAVVKPFRIVNGKETYGGASYALHVAGKNHKLTNVKKISLKKKITLKKGKTAKLSPKLTKEKNSKTIISHSSVSGKGVRFWSSKKKIATVTSRGRISAVSKGRCTIYVMAENGLKVKVEVTVKK